MFDHQTTNNSYASLHWEYCIFPEICSHPDCGSYTSYGLQAYQRQGAQYQIISVIHDISSKRSFVEHLAVLFTRQQLSPLQLSEAVVDFLP